MTCVLSVAAPAAGPYVRRPAMAAACRMRAADAVRGHFRSKIFLTALVYFQYPSRFTIRHFTLISGSDSAKRHAYNGRLLEGELFKVNEIVPFSHLAFRKLPSLFETLWCIVSHEMSVDIQNVNVPRQWRDAAGPALWWETLMRR
jgi:hypothetical protein